MNLGPAERRRFFEKQFLLPNLHESISRLEAGHNPKLFGNLTHSWTVITNCLGTHHIILPIFPDHFLSMFLDFGKLSEKTPGFVKNVVKFVGFVHANFMIGYGFMA